MWVTFKLLRAHFASEKYLYDVRSSIFLKDKLIKTY